ncbi:mechanosensitive ion channel family protein [Salinimicrobium soli]|uniref:mechanosensitive ion channel family protein n=1 Tax=Salinimicrobium soli TaxID=1254399 RepID=UPI003AAC109E
MGETTRDLSNFLANYFIEQGMEPAIAHFLNMLINVAIVFILWYVIHYITKKVLLQAYHSFTDKTENTFDDFLVQSNFPRYVSNIFPLLLLIFTVPVIFEDYPQLLEVFNKAVDIYIIILIVLICRSLLRTTNSYMKTHERYRDKPIESYTQVLMIIFWALGIIFIFSELTERSVVNFLISLGAASAIILFIFKDTILGFVASIQVSVNDIVRIGDWITFSKYGADGFVTEINLATVRVQNWDNTYTTIPTYYLTADSFQNWRGMQDSPGRRIKRSLYIKQNSIRYIDDKDIARFEEYNLVGQYIKERQQEINDYNQKTGANKKYLINGRHQTNLGVFRRYALSYLKSHPQINQDMTMMVRHLPPTTQGIPLEIYCFSKDKRWEYFEAITADIFDHLIAAIPYFDLQLFESPSGDDIIKSLKHLVKE